MWIPWLKINNWNSFFVKLKSVKQCYISEPKQESSKISRSQEEQNRWILIFSNWDYSHFKKEKIGSTQFNEKIINIIGVVNG